jgi:hypothetical protein
MRLASSMRSLVLAAALAVPLAGCQASKSRDDTGAKPNEPWTRHLRAPDQGLRSSGLDSKARDIERSLGVQ